MILIVFVHKNMYVSFKNLFQISGDIIVIFEWFKLSGNIAPLKVALKLAERISINIYSDLAYAVSVIHSCTT